MNLGRMAWTYLWNRPLVTALTLIGVMLGAALVSGVLVMRRELQDALSADAALYDLVVGAKGSPLQVVLSSVYHLDAPTGNIPLARYQALRDDRRVLSATPIALGDNYRGFRIVGTTPTFFELTRRGAGADRPLFAIERGRPFERDFEAVLGSQVARVSGLDIGDRFVGTHGLVAVPGSPAHPDHPYAVVGVLDASGTANDRAIFTTLSSVWRIHDHEEAEHGGAAHGSAPADGDDDREVTSVLVRLRSAGLRVWMAQEINQTTESLAAIPAQEVLRLARQVAAPAQRVLLGVAAAVVGVSSLMIVATLVQSAERRRRDLAILRALGAHPREIGALVFLEAGWLVGVGTAGGLLLAHAGLAVAAGALRRRTGLVLEAWAFGPEEGSAVLLVMGAGLAAGLVSALAGYRRAPLRDLREG